MSVQFSNSGSPDLVNSLLIEKSTEKLLSAFLFHFLLLKNKFIKFMLIFQIILIKLLNQIFTEVNFKKGRRF